MHRIRTTLTALLMTALLSGGIAHASIENAGTTAGNFLSVGTGAGILSMGGATLATGKDLNAAAWNPAALGLMNGSQLALAHASLSASTSQEYLASGGRIGGSAMRWGANLLYQSEGSFVGTDATGASTGSFNVSNMAMGLSLARPFGDAVNVGAGLRYVNEKLGDAAGSGIGVDLGLQAHTGAFGFGLAGRNLGGKMKYDSGTYDMPSVIGAGVSWASPVSGLRLAIDANLPKAYYNDVRLGGEWLWQERVALRAGYRMELGAPAGEPLGGPTFGFGAGVAGMWMDYAFLSGQSDAQGQHRFGLTFRPSLLHSVMGPVGANANDANPVATPEHTAVAMPAPVPAPARKSAAPVGPGRDTKAVEAERQMADNARQPQLTSKVTGGDVATLIKDAAAVTAPVAVQPAQRPAPKLESAPAAIAIVAPAPVLVAAAQLARNDDATDAAAAPRVNNRSAHTLRASKPVRVPRLVALAVMPAPKAAPNVTVESTKPAMLRPAVAELAIHPLAATPAPVADAAPAPKPAPQPSTQVVSTRQDAPVVTVVPPTPLHPAPVAVAPAPPSAPSAPAPRPTSVVVGKDETLASISLRWKVSVAAIMMENNLVSVNVKSGAKLKLPAEDKR